RRIVHDARLGAAERAAAGSRLAASTTSYQALQRVQFLITSITDRLQQIAATDDAGSVSVQVFRLQQSLRGALEMTAGFDSRLQPLLTGKLDEFRARFEGISSIPELRLQELGIAEGNLAANLPTGGSDEIAEMGGVVEVLRKNTFERDELLIERAQAADRLEKQVEERTAELAQSVKELRALGEVSQAVNSTIDLQTVLSTIIAKAVELSGTEAGTIFVFDQASQEFQVQANHGMDDALIAATKDPHI